MKQRKLNALIIDPDLSQGRGLVLAFKDMFSEIVHIQNPLEAGAIIDEMDIALILTEIEFSTIDGLELIKTLHQKSPHTKIIIWSAKINKKIISAFKEVDIIVIEKPVNLRDVKEKITNLINKTKGEC